VQMFVLGFLVIVATWIVVVGGRAAAAARFNRALRTYADPIALGTAGSPQNDELHDWDQQPGTRVTA
jgi:hypothetical protein